MSTIKVCKNLCPNTNLTGTRQKLISYFFFYSKYLITSRNVVNKSTDMLIFKNTIISYHKTTFKQNGLVTCLLLVTYT